MTNGQFTIGLYDPNPPYQNTNNETRILMSSKLQRYTSLSGLIHMLSNKRITLLDPEKWDDRNDAHFLSAYKTKSGAKSVSALCLSKADQTYHHWKVFAPGAEGVCISFKRDDLVKVFRDDPRVEIEDVTYKTVAQARKLEPLSEKQLKFLKHCRYSDEKETRIVCTDKMREDQFPSFPFGVEAIERVTLSPWLAQPLVDPMKNAIRGIEGCKGLKVYRSTLTDFKDWKKLAAH